MSYWREIKPEPWMGELHQRLLALDSVLWSSSYYDNYAIKVNGVIVWRDDVYSKSGPNAKWVKVKSKSGLWRGYVRSDIDAIINDVLSRDFS